MSIVLLVYLNTGEQLIGDAVQHADNSITINHPLIVMQVQPGKLGFLEYLQLTEDTSATFKDSEIRHVYQPNSDIVNYWNEHYGSGIVTPASEIILG